MAKRLNKGIDIHHPNMVKTVFILVSIAVVCFLVIVVKYTSFKSEPRASENKIIAETTFLKCLQAYKGRNYASCDRECGGKKLGFNLKFVKTYWTSTYCGTYTVRRAIYPNYSPLSKNFLNDIMNRPSTKYSKYCCVSKD